MMNLKNEMKCFHIFAVTHTCLGNVANFLKKSVMHMSLFG
jgi:hypothetical protein